MFKEVWADYRNTWFANHVHDDYYYMQGEATSFSNVWSSSHRLGVDLHKWLERNMRSPGRAEELVCKTPVDFTDPRIREYTPEEWDMNRSYLMAGKKIAGLNDMLKVYNFPPKESTF